MSQYVGEGGSIIKERTVTERISYTNKQHQPLHQDEAQNPEPYLALNPKTRMWQEYEVVDKKIVDGAIYYSCRFNNSKKELLVPEHDFKGVKPIV